MGFSALIIAGCAAYFSVTGLGVLFSGASVSVMIMAGSLEFAKLVAATYLKQKWENIRGFNRIYLTLSVGILMLITSLGIFGYLSNAFQQQNLRLEQVQREIGVWDGKIKQNNEQIAQLSEQTKQYNQNQGKILDNSKVNNRVLRSIDNRDKKITEINGKIGVLQDSTLKYNEKINEIKNNNIGLEKEIGGFRFVAEAFNWPLNTVVKYFILLIVIVFDPLAIALVIAFNGLLTKKVEKTEESNNQPEKNYEIYGEKPVIVENFIQKPEDSGKFSTEMEEIPVIVENFPTEEPEVEFIPNNENHSTNFDWKPYMHPEFPWHKPEMWLNNDHAVNYWLKNNNDNRKGLKQIRKEYENIKTY